MSLKINYHIQEYNQSHKEEHGLKSAYSKIQFSQVENR